MQYKIPVQIENADPILFWLSLKQLGIIMVWWGIAYSYLKSMEQRVWFEMAVIPAWFIFAIAVFIAIFKISEMTFLPFILSLLRINLNSRNRFWQKWVDSFQPIDIWFLTSKEVKVEEKIDFKSKIDKINDINDKLKKI